MKKYQYLQDAVESVETSCSRKELDIVIIPPESGNKNADSDEEDIQNDVLDIDGLPTEILDEVEIH